MLNFPVPACCYVTIIAKSKLLRAEMTITRTSVVNFTSAFLRVFHKRSMKSEERVWNPLLVLKQLPLVLSRVHQRIPLTRRGCRWERLTPHNRYLTPCGRVQILA